MRGWDREHFLLLLAAAPPLLLQHLRSGWNGWDKDETAGSGDVCRKCQGDVQRLLDELLPKVGPKPGGAPGGLMAAPRAQRTTSPGSPRARLGRPMWGNSLHTQKASDPPPAHQPAAP